MNSELNPQATDFYESLKLLTQNGLSSIQKAVKCVASTPAGSSYKVYQTFDSFKKVTGLIGDDTIKLSNTIYGDNMSGVLKNYKMNSKSDGDDEKLSDVNTNVIDFIRLSMDNIKNSQVSNIHNAQSDSMEHSSQDTFVPCLAFKRRSNNLNAVHYPTPQVHVQRPQFKIPVDNSENFWIPKIAYKPNAEKPLELMTLYNKDGVPCGIEHPYKYELELYQPPKWALEPDKESHNFPRKLNETPLTFINTQSQLNDLLRHLETVTEFAVDLEHHSYRSYLGITCLMQITTNGGDFIIDPFAVSEHIHQLNQVFTNPEILKIFHGAKHDIAWMQRDLGLYVVGMFDTQKAASILNKSRTTLQYIVFEYCHVELDKRFQLADWRVRPIPEEMLEYARSDTHYLLYVWHEMKKELLKAGHGSTDKLLEVFENSKALCLIRYEKPVVTDEKIIKSYEKTKKTFNARQLHALKYLYKWRDTQARELDESPEYLLPSHMLMALAEKLPRDIQGINACCNPMPPFVKQNTIELHNILKACRELPETAFAFLVEPASATPAPKKPRLHRHKHINYKAKFNEMVRRWYESLNTHYNPALWPFMGLRRNPKIKTRSRQMASSRRMRFSEPYHQFRSSGQKPRAQKSNNGVASMKESGEHATPSTSKAFAVPSSNDTDTSVKDCHQYIHEYRKPERKMKK
ncbi:unnamed protein product [Leptidea sinapis]|uniref:Exosome complex component 10 homolog n=1 Tax=Leptidea sinapis TaxID=189913 RepID=A0A5E4QA72_9NEOP|nr:unnamed protein product [Leptidea sinapis]